MIQPVVPAVPAADIHMAVYRRSCSAECEARGVPTPRRLDERSKSFDDHQKLSKTRLSYIQRAKSERIFDPN